MLKECFDNVRKSVPLVHNITNYVTVNDVANIILACGAREFVNRWSEAGPTHHMAAATGRHIDTILKVAKILNVPVEIVTR